MNYLTLKKLQQELASKMEPNFAVIGFMDNLLPQLHSYSEKCKKNLEQFLFSVFSEKDNFLKFVNTYAVDIPKFYTMKMYLIRGLNWDFDTKVIAVFEVTLYKWKASTNYTKYAIHQQIPQVFFNWKQQFTKMNSSKALLPIIRLTHEILAFGEKFFDKYTWLKAETTMRFLQRFALKYEQKYKNDQSKALKVHLFKTKAFKNYQYAIDTIEILFPPIVEGFHAKKAVGNESIEDKEAVMLKQIWTIKKMVG